MIISDKPIPDDLSWVRLRPADEAECAVAGLTGADAVRMSAEGALEAHMVSIDGEPVAFWGYASRSILAPVAYGWLLTLPAIDAHGRLLARVSIRVVDYILQKYSTLVVQTHWQHSTAVRWLEWLGFEEHGPDGDFTLMIKRRA